MAWSEEQIEEFRKRLVEQGEDQILENREMGAYGRGYGLVLVAEHLQSLEAAKEDARRRAESDQRALNEALAEEAKATKNANRWAKWALFVFLLAIIIIIAIAT